eukprot:3868690-Lingulodinium_polyedra.AAC.1
MGPRPPVPAQGLPVACCPQPLACQHGAPSPGRYQPLSGPGARPPCTGLSTFPEPADPAVQWAS